MEKIVERALLYDFYGQLLTEHQRNIYEDVVMNDMSLSEIATEQGISRQGVHDLVKRCDKLLLEYETKLGLVERFVAIKDKVSRLEETAKNPALTKEELVEKLSEFSKELVQEL